MYIPEQGKNKEKRRKRNILWYNPPFDLQVQTNVAQTFLSLIDKHFPVHHKLHKILNRNNVKVSYSCMPNMASQISSHNQRTLSKPKTAQQGPHICNCNNKSQWPLDGKCLTSAIVYQGDLKTDDGQSSRYIGLCERPFKDRYGDHKSSFNNRSYSSKTELSKEFWDLKDKGKVGKVTFSIVRKSSPYQPGSNHCNLCLWEKFHIMKGGKLLNKKDELVSKCRHVNKFLLKNFKSKHKWFVIIF